MNTGTGQGLIEFLGWVQKKGLMKPSTAGARRSAVTAVIEAADANTTDLRTADVEALLSRFTNLRGAKFKPDSLSAYKNRFRSSVEEYLSWLENPDGWRPGVAPRQSKTQPMKRQPARGNPTEQRAVPRIEPRAAETSGASGRLIDYPFPIRDGLIGVLSLPTDLTREEATRLGAFIEALAMPDIVPF